MEGSIPAQYPPRSVRVLPCGGDNLPTKDTVWLMIPTDKGLRIRDLRQSHRIGTLWFSFSFLEQCPLTEFLSVMGRLFVVRAESRWEYDAMKYIAYSEHFAEVPQNVQPPVYCVERRMDSEGRLTLGRFYQEGDQLKQVIR